MLRALLCRVRIPQALLVRRIRIQVRAVKHAVPIARAKQAGIASAASRQQLLAERLDSMESLNATCVPASCANSESLSLALPFPVAGRLTSGCAEGAYASLPRFLLPPCPPLLAPVPPTSAGGCAESLITVCSNLMTSPIMVARSWVQFSLEFLSRASAVDTFWAQAGGSPFLYTDHALAVLVQQQPVSQVLIGYLGAQHLLKIGGQAPRPTIE